MYFSMIPFLGIESSIYPYTFSSYYGRFKLLLSKGFLFQGIDLVKRFVFYRSCLLHVVISPFFVFFFRILGSMYRTKDDLRLKSTKQSGPPFFDLRESISIIFNGFIRESKVCDTKIFFLNPICRIRPENWN